MTAGELTDLVEEQHSVVGQYAETLPEARTEGAGLPRSTLVLHTRRAIRVEPRHVCPGDPPADHNGPNVGVGRAPAVALPAPLAFELRPIILLSL
jgi:hypothetical protein